MALLAKILTWLAKLGSMKPLQANSAPSAMPLLPCLTPYAHNKPTLPPSSGAPSPVPRPPTRCRTPSATSMWSPHECRELEQDLRKLAQDQNSTPEDRKECLHHADNMLWVARLRARQNRHPLHPTLQ